MDAYKKFRKDLFIGLVVYLLIVWWSGGLEYDSTDGDKRSGSVYYTDMTTLRGIYVDAMTGCHYLQGSRGGLTPRLDSSGQHVCIGEEG